MLAVYFSIVSRNVVENRGLNRWQWRGLARRPGKNGRGASLIRALDQPNRKLRPERGHGPTPCLPCCGIPKAERLEIVSWVVQKSLRALIIEIETAYAWHLE